MATRLRYLATVNPPTPEFDELPAVAEVPFLPLEAVWPGERLDVTRRRLKGEVSSGYTRFREGDILVPKITPTFEADRTVLVRGLEGGIAAGTTELHIVRPRPGVEPRFLRYVLSSRPFLLGGEASMIGVAGQKRVPEDWLKDFPVQISEPCVQRAIADYLDAETARIDALIARKRRMIELLGERAAGQLRATIAREPGSAATGLAWLTKAPATWPILRLSLVARVFNGATPSRDNPDYWGGDVPWTASGEVNQGVIREPTEFITKEAQEDCGLEVAPSGSVLVAMIGQGATRGTAALMDIGSTINQNVAAVVPECRKLDGRYLYFLMRAAYDDLRNVGRGGQQAALNCDLLKSWRIPVPPLETQRVIAAGVHAERNHDAGMRQKLEESIDLLTERRQALITAAVTGELTVPGAVA
jgi:type I restriction enzyme S subunit